MNALDLTADAEEYREIARRFYGDGAGVRTLIYLYGAEGQVNVGLSQQVREEMRKNETRVGLRYSTQVMNAYDLGRLLGHVSTLEDGLRLSDEEFNAEPHIDHCDCVVGQSDPRCVSYRKRICAKSATGWHDFVVDTCCHCGATQGKEPE